MFKTEYNRLMSMTILRLAKEFNWDKKTQQMMVWDVAGNSYETKSLDRAIKRAHLEHVLGCLEKLHDKLDYSSFYGQDRKIIKKLIEIGFTRIDLIIMPPSTISLAMLKKISKKKLLKMDARILDIESGQARYVKNPTIAELLKSYYPFGNSFLKRQDLAIIKTLTSLGFSYKDGIFMQHGTKRKFVENLADKEKISKKQATLFADIAEKRYWVEFLR